MVCITNVYSTYGCELGTWHIFLLCVHQVPRTNTFRDDIRTRYVHLRSTPSLESRPSRDSLSTIFAFLDALPSLWWTLSRDYDSRCGGPGCVCFAGCTSSPHTTSSAAAAAVCTIPTHIHTRVFTRYHLRMIPGIIRPSTGTVPGFP